MCPRTLTALALSSAALALTACGGDDEERATTTGEEAPAVTTPAPTTPAPPSGFVPPHGGGGPSGSGALPPKFVECMADRGYEIESPADLNSVPQQAVQACFTSLHE